MFTGIITDIGVVRQVEKSGDRVFEIATGYDTDGIDIGASISHDGVCLTVISKKPGSYKIQASTETLSKTTMGEWKQGYETNLERALKVGDELGGHYVSGHVDTVCEVARIEEIDDSQKWIFRAPEEFMKFIAPKGSIALNGVSLTVNETDADEFAVNLIAHTQRQTNFRNKKPGDKINMEIDLLARYILNQK